MSPVLFFILYILGLLLVIAYIAIFMATLVLWVVQRTTPVKPNEFYTDHQVFYPCGHTKKFKVLALITIAGFVIGIPTFLGALIGDLAMGNKVVPAAIAFAVGVVLMVLIGRLPFRHGEESLTIDAQRLTIKYLDPSKDNAVYYVSRYVRFMPETKHVAARLIFDGGDGEEEMSLHFLRGTDAVTVAKMVDFIKRNGRIPVVQNVQHAPTQQQFVERRKAEAEVKKAASAQNELVNDYRRYPRYLEDVLTSKLTYEKRMKYSDMIQNGEKNEAVRDCQRTCGEGLRIVVDLVERYLTFPDLRMYSSRIYMTGCSGEQIRESLDNYCSIYTEPVFNSAPSIFEVNDTSWMLVEVDCKFTDYINLVLWLSDLDSQLFAYAKPFKEDMPFVYAVPDKTDRNGETCVVYKADASWKFNVPELLFKWVEPLPPEFDIKQRIKEKHGIEVK